MNDTKWWESSANAGAVKLRIKALIPLVIPLLNSTLQSLGVNVLPDQADQVVDAVFVLLFAGMQAWGWLRTLKK